MAHKTKTTIFSQIFARSFAASALIIILFAWVSYMILDKAHRRNVENLLQTSADFLAASVEVLDTAQMENLAQGLRGEKIRSSLIAHDGKVIFDTDADIVEMSNHANRTEVKQAFAGKKSFVARYSETLKSQMVYYCRPTVQKADGTYKYCVRMAMPLERITFAKKYFAFQIITIAIFAIFVSLTFSFFLAQRISNPIKSLTNSAKELALGNFETRIAASSELEISELGESLAEMARELKARIVSLNKRNCELDEIFEHMSEPVFICASDNTLRKYNKSAADLFNIKGNHIRSNSDAVLRHRKLIDTISKTFASQIEVKDEIEIHDSRERTFAIVGIKLPYQFKTPRALFVMHDISYISQNEKLRREFVSDVSHELKTPITSIKMASETMQTLPLEADAKRFLKIVDKETDRLTGLVNDMLLLSRIEFSESYSDENFQDFKLKGALDEAVSINENEASLKRDSITVSCPDDISFKGDFTLVRLAVSNLISNAVKYSPEACKIEISAKRLSFEKIEISVADTGSGIAQEHLSRIFERFYRVDKGRSRALGGTGLGLAIVKHVALLHSGSVCVESEIGRGSIFTMYLKG